MRYTHEMIDKVKNSASEEALHYIQDLEERLNIILNTVLAQQEILIEQSASDTSEIRLHAENARVAWSGFCGYDCVDFRVGTPQQARSLYLALLTIVDYECD